MKSTYQTERDMYPPVEKWLKHFLETQFKKATIRTYDASTARLSDLIEHEQLYQGLASDWPTWEIKVDIVGFVYQKDMTHLAFVECKNAPLTLDHLAQLLGYARITRPMYAFLISPHGPKRSLVQLLKTHNRLDVLQYTDSADTMPRSIVIAQWHLQSNSIAANNLIASDLLKVELGKFTTN